MNFERVIPITWQNWVMVYSGSFQFLDVEFYHDFGPYSKGDRVSCLAIDFWRGTCIEYDEEGNEKRVIRFRAVASDNSYTLESEDEND